MEGKTNPDDAKGAPAARLTFEELSQLNERKLELKRQHQKYMEKHPEITRSYSQRLESIYETAKYMLYHNKK